MGTLCRLAVLLALLMLASCVSGDDASYLSTSTGVTCDTGSGGGSGGGGGTTGGQSVEALSLAERVSILEAASVGASESQAKPRGLIMPQSIDPTSFSATSDYATDPTKIWIDERAGDALKVVNEMLCMLNQTRYEDMLNKGPYRAQVEKAQCRQQRDESQQDGGSSTEDSQPEYENWTVQSSRSSNTSQQIVQVWMQVQTDTGERENQLRAYIEESSSDDNPFGIFTLSAASYPLTNNQADASQPLFKMSLRSQRNQSGGVLVEFMHQETGSSEGYKASFVWSADQGSGTTYVARGQGEGLRMLTYDYAFNDELFLRKRDDRETASCMKRDEYDVSIWRYRVYGPQGQRVELDSGFPIESNGYYGFVGYYGLWMPQEAGIGDGSTVTRLSFDTSGNTVEEDYIVERFPGKLSKHTRNIITLGDVKGLPLSYSLQGEPGQPSAQYRITWDGTSFVRDATWNDQGYWEQSAPVAIDVTHPQQPELHFSSQALGGDLRVRLECQQQWDETLQRFTFTCQGPTDALEVIAYRIEDVDMTDASSVPSALACFENCPDATLLAQGAEPATVSFEGEQPRATLASGTNYRSYGFSDMSLRDSLGQLVSTESEAYGHGVMSGPLFALTDQNIQSLDCGYTRRDPTGAETALVCPWRAWSELEVYYTWQTGPNEWNRYTTVRRSSNGAPVAFDQPLTLQVDYTDPALGYDGTKLYLQYNGYDLMGIPQKCLDKDTGAQTDCGQGVRFVPLFNLPPGQNASDAADATSEYIIKPTEGEERMRTTDASACTEAGLALTRYALLDVSQWQSPANGLAPEVTDAPAVVGGILQREATTASVAAQGCNNKLNRTRAQ